MVHQTSNRHIQAVTNSGDCRWAMAPPGFFLIFREIRLVDIYTR